MREPRKHARARIWLALAWLIACCSLGTRTADAADVAQASDLYQAGEYQKCITACASAIDDGEYSITWRILKINAELRLGRYLEARQTVVRALKRFRNSIRLRWLAAEVYRSSGDDGRASELLDEVGQLTDKATWRYSDPFSRVTLGRYLLSRGADPKEVLDAIYNEVKRRTRFAEPFIAAGELALDKHDYQLAADEFEAALEQDPENPDIHLALARAHASGDAAKADEHLQQALQRNPRHVDSLLYVVDSHITAERYTDAEEVLDAVAQVNPREPQLWAYRAVLAHLESDANSEEAFRQLALAWHATNPEVDHLIGTKLSQKYRFAEAAAYQRRSLAIDADYLPAKFALSQDLLRLGQEEEGWKLAREVSDRDGYHVVAHNLVTLEGRLRGFRTLYGGDFIVRMEPHEADVYGDRVLDLLARAKSHLDAKYEVALDQPVLVEIFPRQQDFAIRTFGLPGGAGFLGVCFGAVITANSPASQTQSPANWESVLWHEYCHVVTLSKTNNKMPRWLSEGISVYEELQANPNWGQRLTPQYREMILGEDLTPISGLSGAFLQPKSPLHLQFAYYQAYLAVEFLVERYGLPTLKRVLVDLGVGMPINDSLQRYAGSMEGLDREFAEYARDRARSLAPDLGFQRPDLPPTAGLAQLTAWNEEHPDNYWGLQSLAVRFLADKQWNAAKKPLLRLIELHPDDVGHNNAYQLLAQVHRELGESNLEYQVLKELVARSSDAVAAYRRLMELGEAQEDWEVVRENAGNLLAVNPLQRQPHRFLARAAEVQGDHQAAALGLAALAVMEPRDPADIHYRLAGHLHELGENHRARLHILKSLEEAPRFRKAHKMLLEIRADIAGDDDLLTNESIQEASP